MKRRTLFGRLAAVVVAAPIALAAVSQPAPVHAAMEYDDEARDPRTACYLCGNLLDEAGTTLLDGDHLAHTACVRRREGPREEIPAAWGARAWCEEADSVAHRRAQIWVDAYVQSPEGHAEIMALAAQLMGNNRALRLHRDQLLQGTLPPAAVMVDQGSGIPSWAI